MVNDGTDAVGTVDVAVVDDDALVRSGLRLLLEGPTSGIRIVGEASDGDEVPAMLAAGAHGFLLKDTQPARMIEMIRSVASGEYTLSPSVLHSVIAAATDGMADPRRAEARKALKGLNEREHQIALGVAEGLSNAEIADRMYLSVPTIKAALTRILANLGISGRVQLAILVHDAG